MSDLFDWMEADGCLLVECVDCEGVGVIANDTNCASCEGRGFTKEPWPESGAESTTVVDVSPQGC